MVGLMAGLQIMVSFTSSKDCTLTIAGQEFYIIAGSLMYPILACGEDYINEFYGREIAKSFSYMPVHSSCALNSIPSLADLPAVPPPEARTTIFGFKTLMGVVPALLLPALSLPILEACSTYTYSQR